MIETGGEKMLITSLLKRLEALGQPFDYLGPEHAEIYAVTPLSVSRTAEQEILCLSTEQELAAAPPDDGANILILRDPESLPQVLSLMQRWLVDDIRHRELLAKLTQAIFRGCGIYELTRHCSRVLSCPVLLFNHNLDLLCQYPEAQFSEGDLDGIADQIELWRLNLGAGVPQEAPRFTIRQIFYETEDYYLCLPPEASSSGPACDEEYLRQVCEVFDAHARRGWSGEQVEELITGLLQRRFALTERELERLKALGWKTYEKYYVLTVERTQPSADDDLYGELKLLLETELYSLGKYWVAILHSEKHLEYTEQHFHKAGKLLRERGYLATLSMGFFHLADCSAAFEQCRTCLKFSHSYGRLGIFSCNRHQMAYLMSVLNRDNRIDLRRFCSPTVLLIYDFDREHNTNYLGTLFIYICSGQSMKQSAAALDIHVNTMYLRVNWLRDEFHIDFNDAHMLYTLRTSIVLLNLCDPNSLAPGTGWAFLSD